MAEVGAVYRVCSRNLRVAVCQDGEHFIGIREKFGSRFLDTEGFNGPGCIRLGYYEYDDPDQPYHVTWVECTEPIGRIEEIPLTEAGDPPSICAHCDGPARKESRPEAPHYWVCEGGCAEDDPRYGINSYWNSNGPLFDALDEIEERVFPGELDDWYNRHSKFDPEDD